LRKTCLKCHQVTTLHVKVEKSIDFFSQPYETCLRKSELIGLEQVSCCSELLQSLSGQFLLINWNLTVPKTISKNQWWEIELRLTGGHPRKLQRWGRRCPKSEPPGRKLSFRPRDPRGTWTVRLGHQTRGKLPMLNAV